VKKSSLDAMDAAAISALSSTDADDEVVAKEKVANARLTRFFKKTTAENGHFMSRANVLHANVLHANVHRIGTNSHAFLLSLYQPTPDSTLPPRLVRAVPWGRSTRKIALNPCA